MIQRKLEVSSAGIGTWAMLLMQRKAPNWKGSDKKPQTTPIWLTPRSLWTSFIIMLARWSVSWSRLT